METPIKKVCLLTFAVIFIAALGNYAANIHQKINVTASMTPIAYCNSNIM